MSQASPGVRQSRLHRLLRSISWLLGVLAVAVPLAVLPLREAIALVLGAAGLTLALIHPAWTLGAAILSVPVQELVSLPGGLSVTQACLLLALLSLALHALGHPERPLSGGRLFWFLAIFVWALGLSAAFTPYSRAEGLRETLRWSTVLLIYLLTLRALSPTPRLPGSPAPRLPHWPLLLVLGCLLLAPAADALIGVRQYLSGDGPASFAVAPGRVRAYGTIGQPNSFAGYLNQAWPLAVGLTIFALAGLLGGAPRRPAVAVLVAAGAAMAMLLAGLLVSFSRGGWVGAVGGAIGLALASIPLLDRRLRRAAWLALAAGAAGAALLLTLGGGGLLPAPLAQRLASITSNLRLFDVRSVEVTAENFAVVERMAHLQAAWNMFQSRPLLGVGPGNYSIAFERPPGPGERPMSSRPWYGSRGHAHNYYLHIAAEAGLLGAGSYLALLGAVAAQAARAVRRARGWLWRGVAAGGAGVVAAVATHNLFENLHVLNMGLQLGTVWALLVLAERSGQGAPNGTPGSLVPGTMARPAPGGAGPTQPRV